MSKKEEEIDHCSICQDPFDDKIMKLECMHQFHTQCGLKWFKNHNTCPLCRDNVIKESKPNIDNPIISPPIPPIPLLLYQILVEEKEEKLQSLDGLSNVMARFQLPNSRPPERVAGISS